LYFVETDSAAAKLQDGSIGLQRNSQCLRSIGFAARRRARPLPLESVFAKRQAAGAVGPRIPGGVTSAREPRCETDVIMNECRSIEPYLPSSAHDRPRAQRLRGIVNAIFRMLRNDGTRQRKSRRTAYRWFSGWCDEDAFVTIDGPSVMAGAGRGANGHKQQALPPRRAADQRPRDVRPEPRETRQRGQEGMSVIRKTPGVRRGTACIGDSRVPVWIIVLMSEAGAGVEEMLTAYPQLTPADCAAALNYARVNRAEIDADITWGTWG
jgi:uncharacterized protein (DUF433 family)